MTTAGQALPTPAPMAAVEIKSKEEEKDGKDSSSWEYSLRKYLLLLATLVATVTYAAGFSPPGGVWQDGDDKSGRLAGDPTIRDTSYHRYLAFYYCNATAFALSLVVIVLILILSLLPEGDNNRSLYSPLRILRVVMVLDLLSLMGAYAAGTCRDTLTVAYSSVLVFLVVVYVVAQMVVTPPSSSENNAATTPPASETKVIRRKLKRRRKVLMLLATFAVSLTYLAGLSSPGGFWDEDAEGGNRPGDAVLKGRHDARLKAFFVSNTTSFVASLAIIVLLLGKNLQVGQDIKCSRSTQLYAIIVVALVGLVVAYIAGSSRQVDTTVYVSALVGAVLACIFVQLVVALKCFGKQPSDVEQSNGNTSDKKQQLPEETQQQYVLNCFGTQLSCLRSKGQGHSNGDTSDKKQPPEETHQQQALDKARSLVLLLATLAATITYQAGLNPPGGLWQKTSDDYKAGDPILLTTNPRRYKAFFYCNSVSFVASLVAIALVQKRVVVKHHALEAAMILDLFGLIGAYAAGSCRDLSSSIYAMALAGGVLVYVVIHVVFFTLDHHDDRTTTTEEDEKLLENRRKRLLLFAILAATITYQAGLTPPSGFRVEPGDRAGDPVLLYNYPRRYTAFFYCNSVSFMLSIALIILLVNRNLYRPAIKSNALSVCTAAGMSSLVGAYAAGSTQHLKTSIYIFVLAGVVLSSVAFLVVLFIKKEKKEKEKQKRKKQEEEEIARRNQGRRPAPADLEAPPLPSSAAITATKTPAEEEEIARRNQGRLPDPADVEALPLPSAPITTAKSPEEEEAEEKKLHGKRKYLMVLGILVASITYQTGFLPPGGVWPGGSDAGDPVMHDIRRARYLAFFYSNSTSFVASIVVIILLLPEWLHKEKWWLRVMRTTILLDLLGLLVAYAAGSSRSWKTSAYVSALVLAVLAYFGIHVALSYLNQRRNNKQGGVKGGKPEGAGVAPAPSTSNGHVQVGNESPR